MGLVFKLRMQIDLISIYLLENKHMQQPLSLQWLIDINLSLFLYISLTLSPFQSLTFSHSSLILFCIERIFLRLTLYFPSLLVVGKIRCNVEVKLPNEVLAKNKLNLCFMKWLKK